MRIAIFNLESLDLPPRSNRPIEVRIDMLRPELERARADIVCLQEVNGQHVPGEPQRSLAALDKLLDDTPYAKYDRSVSEVTGGKGAADVHNLVTLSRLPIRWSRSIRNERVAPIKYSNVTAQPPTADDGAIAFDRPILVTKIDTGNSQTLTVVNCHLRAPLASNIPGQKTGPFAWRTISGWAEGFCVSSIKRNAQALEVRLLVDELFATDPHANLVIAGDFNAEDFESPLRIIAGAEQDTGNGDLASFALVVLDRSIPADRRFSVVHQGRPQMLDHILVSHSVYGRFQDIEIYNEALGDEAVAFARVDRPVGSNHACVVAEFSSRGWLDGL